MYSLVDRIKEVSLRANGLRRKKWRYCQSTYTSGKWVDLFEITGSGVVDYLYLDCPSYASDCIFRITFDDVVWEWKCNNTKHSEIFGGDAIYGAAFDSDYNYLLVPDPNSNCVQKTIVARDIPFLTVDSTGDDLKYTNIFPGGIKFNENFKISVSTDQSYTITAHALYGIY